MKKFLRLLIMKKIFRKKNSHNYCTMANLFPINNVFIGKESYGPLSVDWFTTKKSKLEIGNYVSIGPGVKFLIGGEHNYKRISTYPFQSRIYKIRIDENINRNIVVEDDVWIGYEALIMSGVTIGKGSVIAARSIVTKDVPPYSIYIGNKIIKSRFSNEIIEKLKDIDWSRIEHKKGDSYEKYCQEEITMDNIDKIVGKFNDIE